MDSRTLDNIIGRLRKVAVPSPDAELLRAVAGHRDAGAFAEVVRRHGPMVLGVCRRVLRESADADDAFQATFLVLFRKAGGLKQPDRLAGWLHQVAFRTSRKLRAIRSVRRSREKELSDLPAGEAPADFVWREMRPIFDEELSRLPDKLRLPAVLCFLEGCSKREAARVLGWPEGTFSARLQRARERLRSRFTARGLTLSAGALAVALFDAVESAAVTESLIESTIFHATASSATSHGVQVLAEGVLHAMFVTKLKAAVAVVAFASVIGAGTGWVLTPGFGSTHVVAGQPAKGSPSGKSTTPANETTKPKDEKRRYMLMTLDTLEKIVKQQEEGVKKGLVPEYELLDSQMTLIRYRRHLLELDGAVPPEARVNDPKSQPKDPDQSLLQDELSLWKDRLAWEERMVKKGFLAESDLKKTKLEISRVENALEKLKAKKVQDSKQAEVDEALRKLERDVLEDTIKQLERAFKLTEEAVKKGAASETDLIAAKVKLNEHKLKLLQLDKVAPAENSSSEAIDSDAKRRQAAIEQSSVELNRAEKLFKQNVLTLDELRRRRIVLSRLKAENAESMGDYVGAVRYREESLVEWRTLVESIRKLHDEKRASVSELRTAEIMLAEANIVRLQTEVRKLLSDIVAAREKDFHDAKALYEAKAISTEELRRAERAVSEAKARLTAGR